MKLAISGKGGAGKTTLAALLARTLADAGRPVIALAVGKAAVDDAPEYGSLQLRETGLVQEVDSRL